MNLSTAQESWFCNEFKYKNWCDCFKNKHSTKNYHQQYHVV